MGVLKWSKAPNAWLNYGCCKLDPGSNVAGFQPDGGTNCIIDCLPTKDKANRVWEFENQSARDAFVFLVRKAGKEPQLKLALVLAGEDSNSSDMASLSWSSLT